MLEFIAANLPILICFLIGIGLMVLEAFMPGFGAPGITGLILEIITLVMTWFEHGPLATLGMLLIVLLVVGVDEPRPCGGPWHDADYPVHPGHSHIDVAEIGG